MNRRSFFRRAAAIGAAGAVATPAVAGPAVVDLPDDHDRWGWHFHWTGYKPSQHNDTLHAQWVAYNLSMPAGRQYAYWATTGTGGYYILGAQFNLTWNRAWEYLTGHSVPVDLERNRRRAYVALVEFLGYRAEGV